MAELLTWYNENIGGPLSKALHDMVEGSAGENAHVITTGK
eukprot:SAG22_NODE_3728_length_1557_cov_1.725652_1_plen_39_part_10